MTIFDAYKAITWAWDTKHYYSTMIILAQDKSFKINTSTMTEDQMDFSFPRDLCFSGPLDAFGENLEVGKSDHPH